MQKKLFQRKPERARIDSSPATVYLDLFAATLEKRRYPTRTISRYVFAADRFARWLNRQGQVIQQIGEPLLEAYVGGLGRWRRAGYGGGRLAANLDGHRDRTSGRNATSAMLIGPKTSTSPVKRHRSTAIIASPLGSDIRKIPIWRHGTRDAA